MQVEIKFTPDCEDDGFTGSTTVVRGNIEDLYDLGNALSHAVRAAGFTYVDNVAFEKDDGTMVFGDL